MPKIKFFYNVMNGGDGSAYVHFHADEESAQIACDIEEEDGEAFGDNCPEEVELEFDENGLLLNPSISKEEIKEEFNELEDREDDDDEPVLNEKTILKASKLKLFYTIRNCGDGSAEVWFHVDKESAQMACDVEEEGGEDFGDNCPEIATLKFDKKGMLLNPCKTKEELKKEFTEVRRENLDEDEETNKPQSSKHLSDDDMKQIIEAARKHFGKSENSSDKNKPKAVKKKSPKKSGTSH